MTDTAWTDDLFRQELADLMTRHMSEAGDDSAKLAAIFEVMGTSLGIAVAHGCGGDRTAIALILDGLTQHIIEVASDMQPAMHRLHLVTRRPR